MFNHPIRYFLSVLSIMLCFTLKGQHTNELGSWNGFGLKFELNDKLNIYAESRLRAWAFYKKFYYYEFTFRANYSINKLFAAGLGTGIHETYPETGDFIKPVELSEIRLYQEITEKHSYLRLFFDNRIRLEQRFTTDGYMNRIRFRGGCSIPLNHSTLISKTLFLSFWDELFVIKDKPYTDLNRFFAGTNYKFESSTIQAGWVNQVSYDISEKTRKNFFMITLLFEINRKK